jgi:hypothetical protein
VPLVGVNDEALLPLPARITAWFAQARSQVALPSDSLKDVVYSLGSPIHAAKHGRFHTSRFAEIRSSYVKLLDVRCVMFWKVILVLSDSEMVTLLPLVVCPAKAFAASFAPYPLSLMFT